VSLPAAPQMNEKRRTLTVYDEPQNLLIYHTLTGRWTGYRFNPEA
jgi:hypothetical protein